MNIQDKYKTLNNMDLYIREFDNSLANLLRHNKITLYENDFNSLVELIRDLIVELHYRFRVENARNVDMLSVYNELKLSYGDKFVKKIDKYKKLTIKCVELYGVLESSKNRKKRLELEILAKQCIKYYRENKEDFVKKGLEIRLAKKDNKNILEFKKRIEDGKKWN